MQRSRTGSYRRFVRVHRFEVQKKNAVTCSFRNYDVQWSTRWVEGERLTALVEVPYVPSNSLPQAKIPIGRFGLPDEIASVVAMLATNAYITNKVRVFRPFCSGAVMPWLIDYQRFSLLMEVLLRVLSDALAESVSKIRIHSYPHLCDNEDCLSTR